MRRFFKTLFSVVITAHFFVPVVMAEYNETNLGSCYVNEESFLDGSLLSAEASGIVVVDLPELNTGTLKINGRDVLLWQKLSSEQLSSMSFLPLGGMSDTDIIKFSYKKFSESGLLPGIFSASIFMTNAVNQAPQVKDARLITFKDMTVCSRFPAYDRENDTMVFSITTLPSKGTVSIVNNMFIYTPSGGKTGDDRFVFTASDKFSNISKNACVTIDIKKPVSDIAFSDMKNHWGHVSALRVNDLGIISGDTIGAALFFHPDEIITVGEFALICAEICGTFSSSDITVCQEKFIPSWLCSAVESMAGLNDDVSEYFVKRYDDNLSRIKTAVILSEILGLDSDNDFTANFSDTSSLKQSELDALNKVVSFGLFSGYPDGCFRPDSPITRAEMAEVLSRYYTAREKSVIKSMFRWL